MRKSRLKKNSQHCLESRQVDLRVRTSIQHDGTLDLAGRSMADELTPRFASMRRSHDGGDVEEVYEDCTHDEPEK